MSQQVMDLVQTIAILMMVLYTRSVDNYVHRTLDEMLKVCRDVLKKEVDRK